METNSLKILALSVLLLLMSCSDKKTEVTAPSVLLSEPQMVEIMTDVQILENAINYRRGRSISTNNLKTKGFDAIFSHHGISDSIFFENMDYYNDNPEMMKRVMDSVGVRFQEMQKDLK